VTPELRTLLSELKAPETTKQAASNLISIGESQPAVRNVLNDELPKMLLQAIDLDVMQSEAMVAGNLRLEAAISPLVQLLDKPPNSFKSKTWRLEDQTLTRYAELRDDPVARALYEIGPSAIPALSVPLESKSSDVRKRAIRVLLAMKTPESRALLERHLPRENDADLRGYLIANGIGTFN
jgi:HEAT repeat protein